MHIIIITEGPFIISCIVTERPKDATTDSTKNKSPSTVKAKDGTPKKTKDGTPKKTKDDTPKKTKDDTPKTKDCTPKKTKDDTLKEIDVYLCVSKNNCVYGTKEISEASQFHVIPTGDPKHPNEFFIVHWRGNRHRLTNVNDPIVQSRGKKTNLPFYLTTNTNVFGESEGPLRLKSTFLTNQARFCLHSRGQATFAFMMCLSHPVSLSDWIEGEQFYINCSRRAFKIDGYISIVQEKETEVQKKKTEKMYEFKTATSPSISDPSSKTNGMLFQLHAPPKTDSKPYKSVNQPHEKRVNTEEAGEFKCIRDISVTINIVADTNCMTYCMH